MNPIITSLLFLILSAVAPAAAQSFQFQVDFDFAVAGRPLPAGTYRMEPLTHSGVAIRIRNIQTGQSLFLNMPSRRSNLEDEIQPPKIAFRCIHQDCEIDAIHNLRPGLIYRRLEGESSKKDVYHRVVALSRAAN